MLGDFLETQGPVCTVHRSSAIGRMGNWGSWDFTEGNWYGWYHKELDQRKEFFWKQRLYFAEQLSVVSPSHTNPVSFLIEFWIWVEAYHEYHLSWCQQNILEGLHGDNFVVTMRTLKHSSSLTPSSSSHVSSWVLRSSFLASVLKLGIADLDKDTEHTYKFFKVKALGEISDMLNGKFKISRDLDRMKCANKADTIKCAYAHWEVPNWRKDPVQGQRRANPT